GIDGIEQWRILIRDVVDARANRDLIPLVRSTQVEVADVRDMVVHELQRRVTLVVRAAGIQQRVSGLADEAPGGTHAQTGERGLPIDGQTMPPLRSCWRAGRGE